MQKIVALTFDDGPSEQTLKILDTLEKHNAKATFFVIGHKVEENPDIVKKAHCAGHEICNHSWNHPNMSEITADEIRKELVCTSEIIEKTIGTKPKLMRPPYGSMSDEMKCVCAEQGLPIIIWSVDPWDWDVENKTADDVYEHIIANMHDRAIILCHDMYESTAAATARVVPELISMGYQLVTVSELLCLSGITPEAGAVYDNG